MVNYLLDELPIMLTGVKHEGIHYKTILYPTGKAFLKELFDTEIANWPLIIKNI